MFKCDELIYIQLQKTGCQHIASLLSSLFHGEKVGEHNAATAEQVASDKYFISSIRNPWEWYLSLWTFGVQGNGGVANRLTKKNYRSALRLAKRKPKTHLLRPYHEWSKNVTLWRAVYDRSDNVESFRRWLVLIQDPRNSRWLNEGYERTAITGICGFMTYRYLYLCCTNIDHLANPRLISNYSKLVEFESRNCYIDLFVRQESLEEDLIRAIEKIRPVTNEEKSFIYGAKRTNTSKRPLSVSDYYDRESIELVRSRERLLIEKFDYQPPVCR